MPGHGSGTGTGNTVGSPAGRDRGPRRRRHRAPSLRIALAIILTGAMIGGCAAPNKAGSEANSYLDRAVTAEQGHLTVTTAALSAAEAEAMFSAPLVALNIQPVWLQIENRGPTTHWLFPLSLDPDYFPPYEVARRAAPASPLGTDALYRQLSARQIATRIGPGEQVAGFVYTHADEGLKAINVDLVGHRRMERFHFVVPVPGLPLDQDGLDIDSRLTGADVRRIDDPDALRLWLQSLPCCTVAADGEPGDPLNLVLVGSLDAVRAALVSRSWDVTARLTTASLRRIITAGLFGSRYRYAPISGLYVFDRVQDLTFQKSRAIIDERNHMRLWLAPVTYRGTPVWIGQISRDVGVKLSGRVWPPTTHIIDPDVDDGRFYLVQDLLYGHTIERIGFVEGMDATPPESPRINAEGDPYFTDGLRAVLFLTEAMIPLAEVELLDWRMPAMMEPFAETAGATRPEQSAVGAGSGPPACAIGRGHDPREGCVAIINRRR